MALWVTIEPKDKEILSNQYIKRKKNKFVVAERFLSNLLKKYGKHHIYIRRGT